MARVGVISVTVKNWGKYNPRADRTNHVWFRFENSYFDDPEIFELTADEQRLHILCCCGASKANSAELKLSLRQAASKLRISEENVEAGLKTIEAMGLIAVKWPDESRHDDGVSPRIILTTDRQTDNTDRQTNTGASAPEPPDFVPIWNGNCGSLPKIREMTGKRLKAWAIRWREKPDHALWQSAVRSVAQSSFCTGAGDPRAWKANVDWFLRPDTIVGVLEGKWRCKPPAPPPPPIPPESLEWLERVRRGNAEAEEHAKRLAQEKAQGELHQGVVR